MTILAKIILYHSAIQRGKFILSIFWKPTLTLKVKFQFELIRKYLNKGGSVLILMSEGGETEANTNINFLLEEFGISCNDGSL